MVNYPTGSEWNSTRISARSNPFRYFYKRHAQCTKKLLQTICRRCKIIQTSLIGSGYYTDQSYRKRILCRPVLSEADIQSLQSHIDNLIEWSHTWQLPFNETKYKHLHTGRGMKSQTDHMNGHVLENVTEEKDLGVIIDDKFKFHTHTSAARKHS